MEFFSKQTNQFAVGITLAIVIQSVEAAYSQRESRPVTPEQSKILAILESAKGIEVENQLLLRKDRINGATQIKVYAL